MAILETKDLTKCYGSGSALVRALDGVSLAVEKGCFLRSEERRVGKECRL